MSDLRKLRLVVASLTDIGHQRKNNEDSHGYFQDEDPARGCLLVVADGMGGASAGEVASRIAVETVRRSFGDNTAGSTATDRVLITLERANAAIHREAETNPELAGMGTTCTVALIIGTNLFISHVGDSRAYLIRKGKIKQLTEDHTLAAEAERMSGSAEPPAWVPRHLLTRSLGVSPTVHVDVISEEEPLGKGDVLVLCSDGLTGPVEPSEILYAVRGDRTPEEACRELVDLALERGGPDNITVQVARVECDT